MNNVKFAACLVGIILGAFLASAIIFVISQHYIGHWALAPTLAFATITGLLGGRFLFKAANLGHRSSSGD